MSGSQSNALERYEDRKIRLAEEAGDTLKANYWRTIKAHVDKAPPLGPRQKALLRQLLTPPDISRRSA